MNKKIILIYKKLKTKIVTTCTYNFFLFFIFLICDDGLTKCHRAVELMGGFRLVVLGGGSGGADWNGQMRKMDGIPLLI